MEAKSSTEMGQIRRSFYPMFANGVHAKNDVARNLFTFFWKFFRNSSVRLDTYNSILTTLPL